MLANGMALFCLAIGLGVLACLAMRLVYGGRCGSERDERLDRVARRAVCLSDGDVSLDEVCGALSGEDMSGFHLSCDDMAR